MMTIPTDSSEIVDLLRERVPEFASGALRIESCEPRWVRKKMRKHLAEFEVRFLGQGGSRQSISIIAKQYPKDRGGHAYLAMCWLHAQGFWPEASLSVSRALFYDPQRFLLLQGKAEGVEVASALQDGESTLRRRSQQAAHWLAMLHQSDGGGFKRSRASAVRSIHSRLRRLAKEYPDIQPRLDRFGEELVQRLRDSRECPSVPTHGDYHPKNIFAQDDQVTVIDLDHFGLREAAADVGYFLGQMAIMAYLKLGSFSAALPAVDSFLEAYHDRADLPVPWDRTATHVSRTFVQSLHYELCVLRNGRTDLIEGWLHQAEQWLQCESPDGIEELLGKS